MVKYLLIVICLISFNTWAQQGNLKGQIVSNGKPVAFASIGIKDSGIGTTADINGFFSLDIPQTSKLMFIISAVGYQKKEVLLTENELRQDKLVVDLIENPSRIQEVVISGTMQETFLLESPVPVEVYTPAFFRKNPTPALFEALQLVNGVQPQLNCNVCNTGDIHINGMEGPYTMVLIDGMPIVSALATVYGLSGIPNSMIERVEVVKGPASTLYGSEAVAGLINIITKSSLKAPVFTADIFVSTDQEVNADFGTSIKTKKATGLLSVNTFHFQNKLDRNNDNFTDLALQKRISVFNKWDFKRKNNRTASIAARYQYEDRWGGELNWNDTWRTSDSIYGESVYTNRYEVFGQYQLPVPSEQLSLQYSLTGHDQNSAYGTTSYIANQTIAFGQLTWNKKVSLRHSLLSGAACRFTFYDDNTPATGNSDNGNETNNPEKTLLPGIFVQDEWKLHENHTLLSGLRYDYHQKHKSIFSPRINYKWAPNTNHIIRIGIGNGYRVVNLFTEDHAALTGSRKVVIKNELKPEKSYNINLNYNKFTNLNKGYLNTEFSVFYTYFTNKITGDFLTNNNLIIYDNLDGYAISRGLSMNADAAFNFPLRINAGATFLDVFQVDKTDDSNEKTPQLHAPSFSGTFTVSYAFKHLGLTTDYTGYIYGPMYLPVQLNDFRDEKSPWFTEQNIQITKKLKNGLEMYGGIKNIFNFRPVNPLMRPFDPFDKSIDVNNPDNYTFDTNYNYASLQGRRGFLGIRFLIDAKEL